MGVRAVICDLDGTLYLQRPLRRAMLLELAREPLRSGLGSARETVRRLRVFRDVREELRALGRPAESLAELQYRAPAERLGVAWEALRETVVEWIHHRPLRHLAGTARPGIASFLERVRGSGVRTGVFSDYPARAKLDALGLGPLVELDLCATDAAVNAFKPHPGGFLAACEGLGVAPGDALYIGDRPSVDGAGARAAGLPVVVLSRAGRERPMRQELEQLLDRVLQRT